MNINKKLLMGGFAFFLLGMALVSAGSYYNVRLTHEKMTASDNFGIMHAKMLAGDFEAAEEYHNKLNFDCPIHNMVKSGEISPEEFQLMHGWMITGNFPNQKPDSIGDDAWNLHVSHHPMN